MLPPTYHKLVATKLTSQFRDAATLVEEPLREPASDEVVIQNVYAAINASDVNISEGRYEAKPTLPVDLGIEAAGIVVAVGEDVERLKVGAPVVTGTLGGFRDYNVVKARYAVPVAAVSPEVLTIPISGLTASIALHEVARMGQGETVLVTAAAGGTGQYAVQLAKLAGNHVIGTCGSAEKAEFLRSIGCDRPINYREENLKQVLRKEYPEGVNLVYESVGGRYFDTAVGALARRGRLLMIGYISEYMDGPEKVTRHRIYTRLLGKSASLLGFFLPHYREHYREHTQRLSLLISEGDLQVAIDPTPFVGLESVADAVEYLHSGQSMGKVVVQLGKPDNS